MAAITGSGRTLSCAEQYRSMAFAQLTYRESLRDRDLPLGPRIETLSLSDARYRRWPVPPHSGVGPDQYRGSRCRCRTSRHLGWQAAHALDMLRGYVDFARLYVLHQHACQVEHRSHRVYSARPASVATRPSPWTASPRQDYPELLRRIRPRVRQDALLASGRHHLRALQKPLAGGTLLQVDQAASSDQAVLRRRRTR